MLSKSIFVDWSFRIWQNDETVFNEIKDIFESARIVNNCLYLKEAGTQTSIELGSDPITTSAFLFFGIVGQYWHYVPECREIFEYIQKNWKYVPKKQNKQRTKETQKETQTTLF